MNKRLDEFNEQIGTWKKNVNSALDKVKLENEIEKLKLVKEPVIDTSSTKPVSVIPSIIS